MPIRLVILESPYAGDALARGEAPIASHLLYTQPDVLDDSDPAERQQGVAAGLAWGRIADATVVYTDLGISPGMRFGVQHATAAGRPVEYRAVPGWPG